ncbi:MAG: NDP-sugar synthase [Clostridia bacterium]|nr:NDP-sugar synthase [Clostridia bacterium]
MKAVIFALSAQKSLMPLSYYKPDCLLPVANRPILDYAVSRLFLAGIKDLFLIVGENSGAVEEYARGYLDLKIHILRYPNYNLRDLLSDNERIIVVDPMLLNLSALVLPEFDEETLLMIESTASGRHSGTYIISAEVLGYVSNAHGSACDLASEALLMGAKTLYFKSEGYNKRVRDIESYYTANFDLMRKYYPEARRLDKNRNRRLGSSLISSSALVSGRVKDCIIGDGAVIPSSANLTRCIVLPGQYVPFSSRGNIIGRDFTVNPLLSGVNLVNSENTTNIFRLFAEIKL